MNSLKSRRSNAVTPECHGRGDRGRPRDVRSCSSSSGKEEELQATIGVSLIQELDQEIPDVDAERIENEGEVQKFVVPDQTAGESPAEELIATSMVRQPPFFNIPQFRSPQMMVRLKRRKSRSSSRPLHPRQKLCRRLRQPQHQTPRLQSLTLLCRLQVGRMSQLMSLHRQANAWAAVCVHHRTWGSNGRLPLDHGS